MSQLRYAVWYEPTGKVYDIFNKIIRQLAVMYHSPVFEPHITLLPGGTSISLATIINKLEKIISITTPFETRFTSYSYLDEYFKCIFVQIEKASAIMDFAHTIQQEINGQPTNDYTPHLSIFYGQLPVVEKEKIIKNLEDLNKKHFTIDKVHVIEYELGKPPESWKKVAVLPFRSK